jgi:hypothetical protein
MLTMPCRFWRSNPAEIISNRNLLLLYFSNAVSELLDRLDRGKNICCLDENRRRSKNGGGDSCSALPGFSRTLLRGWLWAGFGLFIFNRRVPFYFHEIEDLAETVFQTEDRPLDREVFFLFIHPEVFVKTGNPASLFQACLLFIIIAFHGRYLRRIRAQGYDACRLIAGLLHRIISSTIARRAYTIMAQGRKVNHPTG